MSTDVSGEDTFQLGFLCYFHMDTNTRTPSGSKQHYKEPTDYFGNHLDEWMQLHAAPHMRKQKLTRAEVKVRLILDKSHTTHARVACPTREEEEDYALRA